MLVKRPSFVGKLLRYFFISRQDLGPNSEIKQLQATAKNLGFKIKSLGIRRVKLGWTNKAGLDYMRLGLVRQGLVSFFRLCRYG